MTSAPFNDPHGYSEANFAQMARDKNPRIDQLRHVAVTAYLAGQRMAGIDAPALPNPAEIDQIISDHKQ
ncbi:MAG: hypothetical protein OEN23_02695 [Paracoccaceae bacterium]|nr:hypothetical protein [Paracoccaceae bacterium]